MFPQRHNYSSSGSGLDQMLQLPSAPMPMPMPMPLPIPVDRLTNSSRWKPNIEVAPNCPRCASTNTKFCYYNNYSLSQPRYFCKGCRRYWTKGGSLRNVPVGGGCRKNRRGKSMRHPQTECNGNSGTSEDRNSSVGDDQARENIGSRDIDMALVFAKYLNQNVSFGEEIESEHNNGSTLSTNNLSTPESAETDNDAVLQPQKPFDPITDFDAVLLGGGAPVEEMVQNFVGEDQLSLGGIELEGLMGVGVGGDNDDVVHDVLWSDAPMSSSVAWQPPMMQMQLQELEYSMSMPVNEESQLLPVSSTMNLMCDSWSTWNSFDFSTMEVSSHQDLNHQL